jgi:alpha-N-acetylglucosaminidase
MKKKVVQMIGSISLFAVIFTIIACSGQRNKDKVKPALDVITRIVGSQNAEKFELTLDTLHPDSYSITVVNNKVHITGSSQVALCRGAYDYLSNACNSMVSWSGNRINIPGELPVYSDTVHSLFKYHYYLNVVTHGYTMAYWDWQRWEKEIDWMAMHGMDMPLLSGAHEAILLRVFKKLGLTQKEINEYFTGPAYFPWNKMGNITAWDGPAPESFYAKQVKLNHQILDRMRELGMHPIVPAFAGFVPKGIQRIFPKEKVRELEWCLFEKQYHAFILEPGSELFIKIGKMYIAEWEKEFGKSEFYLADSFNEMDVPLSHDSVTALNELASYGESVYRSIHEVNPNATWVMQGWTFPFQKKDGKLFWTPERLHALVSKVPDDKLLILDLANEFNRLRWHIEASWKMYEGFFGKQWIYSFIPNMGGNTPLNGRLDLYASMPFEALNYPKKGNLIGFGFAPEGIENNEIVYELLTDVGWSNKEINLNEWIKKYCMKRYGAFPEKMKMAFDCFNASCYGNFISHPVHTYQYRPDFNGVPISQSDDFRDGVQLFLECKDSCSNSKLYAVDAIEFTCQYLGLRADKLLQEFKTSGEKNYTLLDEALNIVADIDKLLESHPNFKLQNWTTYARNFGDNPAGQDYYESDARRLITTWGGGELNEYAPKTWSGIIRDYYIPRWRLYYDAKKRSVPFDMKAWEEQWIKSNRISKIQPFDNPLEAACKLFDEQNDKR